MCTGTVPTVLLLANPLELFGLSVEVFHANLSRNRISFEDSLLGLKRGCGCAVRCAMRTRIAQSSTNNKERTHKSE